MGLIKEKEKLYVDAANHYSQAWKMSNRKNGGVGFRLAFNYLKANRFVDAIDVGKDILKVYPSFPRVQADIIDKARSSLRIWPKIIGKVLILLIFLMWYFKKELLYDFIYFYFNNKDNNDFYI